MLACFYSSHGGHFISMSTKVAAKQFSEHLASRHCDVFTICHSKRLTPKATCIYVISFYFHGRRDMIHRGKYFSFSFAYPATAVCLLPSPHVLTKRCLLVDDFENPYRSYDALPDVYIIWNSTFFARLQSRTQSNSGLLRIDDRQILC